MSRREPRPRRSSRRRGNLVWGECTYRVGYYDFDHPWRNQGIGRIDAEPQTGDVAFISDADQTYNGIPLKQGDLYISSGDDVFVITNGELIVTGPNENLYSINAMGELVMA